MKEKETWLTVYIPTYKDHHNLSLLNPRFRQWMPSVLLWLTVVFWKLCFCFAQSGCHHATESKFLSSLIDEHAKCGSLLLVNWNISTACLPFAGFGQWVLAGCRWSNDTGASSILQKGTAYHPQSWSVLQTWFSRNHASLIDQIQNLQCSERCGCSVR